MRARPPPPLCSSSRLSRARSFHRCATSEPPGDEGWRLPSVRRRPTRRFAVDVDGAEPRRIRRKRGEEVWILISVHSQRSALK